MATQVVNTRPNNSARKTNKQRNRGNQKKPATSVYATPPPAEQTSAENPEAEKGDVTTSASTVEDEEDSDVCWICAEQVKYYSLSECNHRTCHVCALRLRALYKKMDCTFCKVRRYILDSILYLTPATQASSKYCYIHKFCHRPIRRV